MVGYAEKKTKKKQTVTSRKKNPSINRAPQKRAVVTTVPRKSITRKKVTPKPIKAKKSKEIVKDVSKPRKKQQNSIVKDVSNLQLEKNRRAKAEKVEQTKAILKIFTKIAIVVVIAGIISYRNALINAKLAEKESIKSELESVSKENAQLQVNIESSMGISTIEQMAKELLGMQKLDNNQKVYVNLDKKDYTESKKEQVVVTNKTWFEKFIDTLKGK